MSAERRFATGNWYAVVGDDVSVMLPGSERARVAPLWKLADSGASADAILDALLAGGLAAMPSFAFVGVSDDVTRVIVRGAPTVTVTTDSGEQVISAAPGTTWNEQVLSGVTSGRVSLDGDAAAELTSSRRAWPGSRRWSSGQPSRRSPPTDRTDPVAEPAASPDQAPEDVPVEEPLSFGEPAADPTPTARGACRARGHRRADDWSDRDGQTTVSAPAPRLRPAPRLPGQPPAPSVTARPVARLVLSSGETVDVDRAVLVGRAPEARRFASHEQPRMITVPSPHQEISSTHLEVRPGAGADHGSAVVTDMGSTNGTVLVQPGLLTRGPPARDRGELIPGAIIDLGDGVTIQVTNP